MKDIFSTSTSKKLNAYSDREYTTKVTVETTAQASVKTKYQAGQIHTSVKDTKSVKRDRIQALNSILEKAGL